MESIIDNIIKTKNEKLIDDINRLSQCIGATMDLLGMNNLTLKVAYECLLPKDITKEDRIAYENSKSDFKLI